MNDIDENLEAYEKAEQIAQLDFSHLGMDDFGEVEYDDDGNPYGIVQGVPVAITPQPQGDGVQRGPQLGPNVFRSPVVKEEAAAPESGYSELGSDMARGFFIGQDRAGKAFTETVATVFGAPVDLLSEGLGYLGLKSDDPIGGSKSIRDGLNAIVKFGSSLIPDDIAAAGESFAAETPQSPLIQMIVDEVTRFGLQAVGPAMYLRAFTVMTPFARGLAWGGIADFINAEPDEESAIAALTKYVSGATEEERGAFANAVLLVVERNENHPEFINKAKIALDGMIIGAGVEKGLEGIILAVRVIRSGALRKTMANAGERADARLRSMSRGDTLSVNPVGAAGDLALSAAGKLARKDELAPVFFSAVRNAVDALPMNKGSASQMRAMIAKSEGVKAEEMAWTGLDDFLKGKKSVTKAEIKEFIDANQVRIEEVTLGGGGAMPDYEGHWLVSEGRVTPYRGEVVDGDNSIIVEASTTEKALEAATAYDEQNYQRIDELYADGVSIWHDEQDLVRRNAGDSAPTKFSEYTLPGGENYREVLLTLPTKQVDVAGIEVRQIEGGRFHLFRGDEPVMVQGTGEIFPIKVPNASFISEDAARNALTKATDQTAFTGGHYDESNVLAHIRLNDRTGPDGERILFIEEIQSDWHQKGRKQGYKTPDYVERLAEHERLQTNLVQKHATIINDLSEGHNIGGAVLPDGKGVGFWSRNIIENNDYKNIGRVNENGTFYLDEGFSAENPSVVAKFKELAEINVETGKLGESKPVSVSVPDAPLKKTWHETSLRRVIRMAAEEGYDSVAWTPGRMQADRYDLSKQVDTIAWAKQAGPDGKYKIDAIKDGSSVVSKEGLSPDELGELIGKDAAEKITGGGLSGELSGLDLKVGGEGMKAFYDKILKKYAEKFGKKFGAKVGTVKIIGGDNKPISFEEFITSMRNADDEPFELIDIANNPGLDRRMNEEYAKFLESRKSDQVWNIPITKKMRESVLKKGVPLFSAAGAAAVATQDKEQPAI